MAWVLQIFAWLGYFRLELMSSNHTSYSKLLSQTDGMLVRYELFDQDKRTALLKYQSLGRCCARVTFQVATQRTVLCTNHVLPSLYCTLTDQRTMEPCAPRKLAGER